ncbi:peroxisomal leader peptide-processing protease isoform X2 [Orussus abietinus]|uniref:peroxisomal leader peptide-processing protease isoform X2 n=1 Tax=Orussus abietinus TaxID=222816 RepID=UPI000626AB9E|nr:peroxisomal leader peptide-processing protease isoform X2 [Orussus abietinus]
MPEDRSVDEETQPESVLLLHTWTSRRTREVAASSGALISKNWVLTHGSSVEGCLATCPKTLKLISNLESGHLVLAKEEIAEESTFRVIREELKNPETNLEEESALLEREGVIAAAWRCPLLKDTLDDDFRGWKVGNETRYTKKLLPVFLLIKLEKTADVEPSTIQKVLRNLSRKMVYPGRGSLVEVESTPFGNPVFIGSVGVGVVSKILGSKGSILLTDAIAYPSSVGGPVYVSGAKSICGMVIASSTSYDGERVDFTLVANLSPCLRQVTGLDLADEQSVDSRLYDLAERSVVVVRCGSDWGSGILLCKETGTILTCSHVVKKAPGRRIRVTLRRSLRGRSSSSAVARLVYRTTYNKPYDVAILRVDPEETQDPLLRNMNTASGPVLRGEPVALVGFPLFPSTEPTISRGYVSRVSWCMVQTSCCVQSGTSGGPVIRWSTGEMIGMMVSNVRSDSGLYPHLNMAIPVSVLSGPLGRYLKTGDTDPLKLLECDDAIIRRAWDLHQPPPSAKL